MPISIDYTLCGEALIPSIFSFSVLPYTELSDHCCISTFIKINRVLEREGTTKECDNTKVNPNPPKLKFDRDRVHIFQRNVQLSEKLEPLKTLINKPELNKPDIDLCVLKLRDRSTFMGYPGRVYRWGGQDFFVMKKRGAMIFFDQKKGGLFFFSSNKRGAQYYFS